MESKVQDQAKRLKTLLSGTVVPRRVDIIPADAMHGCVAGRVCFLGRWRSGKVANCPHHGYACKHTLHDDVCRSIADMIYTIDGAACMLPECPVGLKKRAAGGRYRRGPPHTVDLLVVLNNGNIFAVEVDGDSHRGRVSANRDIRKDSTLAHCNVYCHRFDIRQTGKHGQELSHEYAKLRELVDSLV